MCVCGGRGMRCEWGLEIVRCPCPPVRNDLLWPRVTCFSRLRPVTSQAKTARIYGAKSLRFCRRRNLVGIEAMARDRRRKWERSPDGVPLMISYQCRTSSLKTSQVCRHVCIELMTVERNCRLEFKQKCTPMNRSMNEWIEWIIAWISWMN